MVEYEFLYYPIEGATEEHSADPIDVILKGETYEDCVKQFAKWVEDNESLIESIDEEAEQYENGDRMNPRKFRFLPSEEQPFVAYV
jgi:hypothetical protein